MSSPADNKNATISFSNDVEEQAAAAASKAERRTPNELRNIKDRASLTQSQKEWDLDGDGELDEAELALRNLDTSHKGTLGKDQMYKLMTENLNTQRELFKVKKIVMGLVGFTCILAVSNLGTSLAAAFLAKDTKSEDDKLTDTKTGRTLATQTTSNKFTIDKELDQEFSRRRMLECTTTGNGNNGVTDCTHAWDGSAMTAAVANEIIEECEDNSAVTIVKTFNGGAEVNHDICRHQAYGYSFSNTGTVNGNAKDKMTVGNYRGGTVTIEPDSADTSLSTIVGLKSLLNEECELDTDCVSSTVCESGFCKTKEGRICDVANGVTGGDCISDFSCLDEGHEWMSGTFKCRCTDHNVVGGSCGTGRVCNVMAQTNNAVCQCANDDGCDAGKICGATCGMGDVLPWCATQDQFDDPCLANEFCDQSRFPTSVVCLAAARDGRN